MESYGPDVHRLCSSMLRDATLVDDVHQSVFVQAYEALPHYSAAATPRTWLFAIARHRCLDALKRSRRWFRRFELVDRVPETTLPSLEHSLELRDAARHVEHCLGELAPEVRAAVLLRYQQEMTFEEMAKICDARAPTLQARVMRAMPRLRECLARRSRGAES